MIDRRLTKVVDCPGCGGKGHFRIISAEALRTVRENAGVSLREMAKRLKFSPPYLSDVELGKRRATEKIGEEYSKL